MRPDNKTITILAVLALAVLALAVGCAQGQDSARVFLGGFIGGALGGAVVIFYDHSRRR